LPYSPSTKTKALAKPIHSSPNHVLANHGKSRWPNYHDDGEENRSLPGGGLPQFVLIDDAGRIVFATAGFDEHDLRAALVRVAPQPSARIARSK
jgi:hypothetical protein